MLLRSYDPDALASGALRLLAAINTLAFASFVLLLALGLDRALAQAPVCTGTDLLAEMEAGDPTAYARLTQASADEENGEALLWRIETPAGAVSHLYGTMHLTDPRVLDLSAEANAAFEASETLVIETTDILDPAAMMAAMAANPDLMMFTDGTTLTSLLDNDERALVDERLSDRGMSLAAIDKMKPWMLAAMVTLPACELARKSQGAEILDADMAARAKAAGMKVEGLETTAEQLGAMAALPIDFHIRGLVETLGLGDRVDDLIETMVVIYERGEPGLFWPFFEAVLPGATDGDGIAAFEQSLIIDRNHTMAERLQPMLESGGAFVAVGALHLPGVDGLVTLLRAEGLAVTEVPAGS